MINIDYLLNLHLIGKKPKKQDEPTEEIPEEPILISKIYGVVIDTSNEVPESAVSYTNDARGLNPAKSNSDGKFSYGSWLNRFPFNQIKPCLFKNGRVVYYLDPDDYTKRENGNPSNITSNVAGDVMIEFPTIYWKIETIADKIYIRYSDVKIDSTYQALAHQKGTKILDKIYIGAYLSSNLDNFNIPVSVSGKEPAVITPLSALRNTAKANYSEYEVMGYYQLLMLQVLYIVMFKNMNSQSALGGGYTSSGGVAREKSGNLNKVGLFYGLTGSTYYTGVKFCGIEHFHGNIPIYIDGIIVDSSGNIKVAIDNYNNDGTGYVNFGKTTSSSYRGFLKNVKGTTNLGFFPTEITPDGYKYYGDDVIVNNDTIGIFSKGLDSSNLDGMFALTMVATPNGTYTNIGNRIMCRV